MHNFTLIFLAALALSLTIRLWLAIRQIRHIAQHRSGVPGEFAAQISLSAHQKAADYSIAKTRLGIVHTFVDAALLLGLTLGGGLEILLQGLASLPGGSLGQGTALLLAVFLISSLVELPLGIYHTFVIDERFGFNKTTPALYAADLTKQAALGVLIGAPLLWGILWLMEEMGNNWWLWVWQAWMGFNLLMLAVYPTLIAPIFNKFAPLEDAELKERVERLLDECSFAAKGLFVMDGSRRSTHGNAYFTGFGKSRRIVFFDTLLERLGHHEIVAVLAHELGHFKHRHIVKRIVLIFTMSLAGLWLLGQLMSAPWFFAGLGVTTPGTAVGLALFLLVGPLFTFLLQPLLSLYSRKHEFEADRYAAQHAPAGDLISALVKLYNDNAATLTPDPLHSAFYDSHPPASVRVAHLRNIA